MKCRVIAPRETQKLKGDLEALEDGENKKARHQSSLKSLTEMRLL